MKMRTMWLCALMACAPLVSAAGEAPVDLLVAEMGFHRAMQASQDACVVKADAADATQAAADAPALFAGITPDDARWDAARALYLDMLRAACVFDMAPVVAAYRQALATHLDADEIDAMLAFYRSDLGRRFEAASHAGNVAVNDVLEPMVDADTAYAVFGEGIRKLAGDQEAAPAASVPDESAKPSPRTADAALASGDAVVALSDRMMQAIASGDARAAFALASPYSSLPAETFDTLATQFDAQSALVAENYGRSLDHILLTNDSVGGTLMRNVYLHRHERYATVWLFLWYRGEAGWTLTSLRFADDLNGLFR